MSFAVIIIYLVYIVKNLLWKFSQNFVCNFFEFFYLLNSLFHPSFVLNVRHIFNVISFVLFFALFTHQRYCSLIICRIIYNSLRYRLLCYVPFHAWVRHESASSYRLGLNIRVNWAVYIWVAACLRLPWIQNRRQPNEESSAIFPTKVWRFKDNK